MNDLFNTFIDNLDLNSNSKEKIKKDIQNNWMCEEWCMQFLDAGRLPMDNESFGTTNNFTARMNRTIEATYSGKQTVLTFVERLYGVTLMRENLTENHSGKLIYEAGLVTTFNAQSIEQVSIIFLSLFNLKYFFKLIIEYLIARITTKNITRYVAKVKSW